MELDDLRTFAEVAEAGGVTPAARRLGVSKSVVSRRLRRLEEALGVRLLARNTRGASLTQAGERYREHAGRIIIELDAAREAIAENGEVQGRLRISAPVTFGPAHIAPILAELAMRHPRLSVQAVYTDRFVDLVGEGFDAALRLGYLTDSDLKARRIAPMHGRLVASPTYLARRGRPETPEDLLDHEALMQDAAPWRLTVDGVPRAVAVRGRFKSDNGEALAAAALAGLGVAALPEVLVAPHLASGGLVSILDAYPPPEAGLYLMRPPGQPPSRRIEALADLLAERFAGTRI